MRVLVLIIVLCTVNGIVHVAFAEWLWRSVITAMCISGGIQLGYRAGVHESLRAVRTLMTSDKGSTDHE